MPIWGVLEDEPHLAVRLPGERGRETERTHGAVGDPDGRDTAARPDAEKATIR